MGKAAAPGRRARTSGLHPLPRHSLSKAPSPSPSPTGVSPPQGCGSSGSWGPCIVAHEQTVAELFPDLTPQMRRSAWAEGSHQGAEAPTSLPFASLARVGPGKSLCPPPPPAGQQLLHGQEGRGEPSIHPQLCSHHASTGENPACLLPGCTQNRTPQPTTR